MSSATTSNKLEDQAATAALYAHKPKAGGKHAGHPLLDEDGKLSSAGAATSLKYAKAQDLPSYPSAGLKLSSAGAAASLADHNKSTFEHWKPGSIPAANKAALLAKDYEMDPLWQPETSAAGSKAALLAHRDTASVEPWTSSGTREGHAAADQALKSKTTTKYTDRDVPADAHQKALLAATGAMAGNRQRAGSAPQKPVDSKSWAMKAANHSHKDTPGSQPFTSGDPGFEAARIQNMAKSNVNRQLYGSAPPVDIEVQEKNRQDTLRASAVAMAQKMYAIQQSHIDEAAGVRRSDSHAAANSSHRRNLSDGSSIADEEVPVLNRYENLEEAARKLAQERLAKMNDEHAEYRQYYGAKSPQQRSRLSARLSRRRASTGTEEDSDEEQSKRIRQQMSMFQSKLADVDKNKRQADRDALLAAAHKNVEARMAKMDQQIFQDTGKASPAQREQWERQAREKAQERADLASQNVGKVHIGGGKYLDQSEVDAIARARLQPTLDDISDKAEKQRARDAEIRLEQEKAKADAERDKAREAEVKAETKYSLDRQKQEQKAKRDDEKRIQREQAAAEKERVRLEKEERRRSKDVKPGRFSSLLHRGSVSNGTAPVSTDAKATPSVTAQGTTTAEEDRDVVVPVVSAEAGEISSVVPASAATTEGNTVHDKVTMPTEASEQRKSVDINPQLDNATAEVLRTDETLPSGEKRDSKVKSWFKTHLGGSGKTQKDELITTGGTENDQAREDSIRNVAMAGRKSETEDLYGSSTAEPVSPIRQSTATGAVERSPSISSLSSSDHKESKNIQNATEHPEAESSAGRTGLKHKLMKKIRPNKGVEPPSKLERTNTTEDEFEEARDTFEEQLSPPTAVGNERPRSAHGESKFTEEL